MFNYNCDSQDSEKKKGIHKVIMNYDNYESKIVELHSVAIVGWPVKYVINPGSIGAENVYPLFDALSSTPGSTTPPKCHWVILSEAELEQRKASNCARVARGEPVYKPRKTKKALHSNKNHRSKSVVSSDDDTPTGEDNDNDNGGEDGGEGGDGGDDGSH